MHICACLNVHPIEKQRKRTACIRLMPVAPNPASDTRMEVCLNAWISLAAQSTVFTELRKGRLLLFLQRMLIANMTLKEANDYRKMWQLFQVNYPGVTVKMPTRGHRQ